MCRVTVFDLREQRAQHVRGVRVEIGEIAGRTQGETYLSP